jgi:hypothetical protein
MIEIKANQQKSFDWLVPKIKDVIVGHLLSHDHRMNLVGIWSSACKQDSYFPATRYVKELLSPKVEKTEQAEDDVQS